MFGFANYVRTPKPGVTPFSLPVAIGIIVVLSALDTVGCVVLIIGSFIFAKMGHKGLGIALALANCVVPDMLPGIDEVFGIVATGGTLLHDYKKGESLPNSIVHAIDAKDVYRNCSEEYEDMDVLQIAQNVASDYATQPAYTDPMPVQQGETELEQIEHLHQLKEKGILTEKEFQEKKKQLLSQLQSFKIVVLFPAGSL